MPPEFVPTPIVRYLDFHSGNDLRSVSESSRRHVLKDYRQERVAVLVSDMSGFTRLTRAHGVVHFASIIARFRQLTYPTLHRYGALAITVEGDSFNAVFPTAKAAVLAACEIQQLVQRSNAALPPERSHFSITLDGIGVDVGIGPLLDRAGKFHGPTFDNAHLLGEEICSGGQVAISQCVYELVRNLPELLGASFGLIMPREEEAQVTMSAMNSIYEVLTPPLQVQNTPLPGADANDFLQAALLPLAGRYHHRFSDSDQKQLEAQFESMYMKPKVALMFDFCFQDIYTAELQLSLKYECLSMLGRIFGCFHVEPMEDVLYFLDDAVDAILVALACGKLVDKRNQQCSAEGLPRILISGIGVHVGQVLHIPDTDIHWGDPVNTASKLSQELAQDGEIYISKQTYAACKDDPRLHGFCFHQTGRMLSGVKFEPYRVEGKDVLGSIERLRFDGALIEELTLYDCDIAGMDPEAKCCAAQDGRSAVVVLRSCSREPPTLQTFSPTPIIRYLDSMSGNGLQALSETSRQHVLKDYRQEQVAMLSSDMSGFTRLTRAFGIVHFASIIARFRQLTYPTLHRYDALAITVEGDSFNVMFRTAQEAVLAACEMQHLVKRSNATLLPEHAHFTLTLDGIGVDFGKGPLLDRAGKFHGTTFLNAHLLGEEICSGGQVAISERVYEMVRDLPEIAGATFGLISPGNDEVHVAASEMKALYEVVTPPLRVQNVPLPGPDAHDFLQAALLPLAGRYCYHISDDERKHLEAKIENMYLKPTVALMIDFCFENAHTAEMQLSLKYECLSVLGRVFSCFRIEAIEDVLYFLDDAVDAILVALACGKLMDKQNQQRAAEGLPRILISGIGIHIGKVLHVPDTDIHWGDPVNTASKLSQELAQNGEIYISKDTYAACGGDPRLHGFQFHQTGRMLSGVKFEPYLVQGRDVLGSVERLRFDQDLIEEFILYDCDMACLNAEPNCYVTQDTGPAHDVLKEVKRAASDNDVEKILALYESEDSVVEEVMHAVVGI